MFILRIVMLAAAVAAVAGGALVHGRVTDRWGTPEELTAATERLAGLPTTVGDWDGVPSELDAETFKMANVTGARGMRYTHRVTQQEVSVMVVVGRPGQVAAHPPEVCYGASGYTVGPKKTRELGRFGNAWEAEFTRAWPTPEAVRLVWGWGRGDQWTASSAPEVAFATSAHLYKIYFVQRAIDGDKDRAFTQGFLDVFLPVCQKAFSPNAGAAQ